MTISDYIASIIEEMLDAGGGSAEMKRNDLANRIGCVPSQINYVITSRFTPERGYIIESRRGGGGYIRIVRKQFSRDDYLMHFFHATGNSIGEAEAFAFISNLLGSGVISEREAAIISTAVSDRALSASTPEVKNNVRADILRHIILTIIH